MPRGSKPGERRGGRQKGTPNKKTALRNAALGAAAADPNLSPLDYLLSVMGDDALVLETRVTAAREALPYFHSKPQETTPRQRYGRPAPNDSGGGGSQRSIKIGIFTGGAHSAETKPQTGSTADPPLAGQPREHEAANVPAQRTMTPLEFLLGVMRNPDTAANLRLRIASLVTRYVHPRHIADGAAKIEVNDPTGFSIDPPLARELRDAKRRYDFLWTTSVSQPEHFKREGAGLRARIEEIELSLECPCPSLYGKKERKADHERLQALSRIRYSGLKLSAHEDVEEAWLTARLASWETIPDGAAQTRLRALDTRRWWEDSRNREPLTAGEKAEFRALRTLYASHRDDQDDLPSIRDLSMRRMTQAHMELRFKNYPLVETMRPPDRQAARG
jgi:hypothetical protein